MFFNVRIYKQHDTDLLMLMDAGFPVAKMMTKALYAYAHGEPLSYLLDGLTYRNISDTKCARIRLNITDKDTIRMFQSLTTGYKNVFCKTVLRNALIQQNVNCFFKQESDTSYQQNDYAIRTAPAYKNVELVTPESKIVIAKDKKENNTTPVVGELKLEERITATEQVKNKTSKQQDIQDSTEKALTEPPLKKVAKTQPEPVNEDLMSLFDNL